MLSKYKLHRVCFFLIIFTSLSYGQNFFPPVANYSTRDYNAASQNWGLSTNRDGVLFVANNEGLLRFDGQRWEVFTLPNHTTIRSVFCQGDRIYTGSYEEFGYWTTTNTGDLKYTSLTHLINTTFQNEEFWQIGAVRETIYFRSFGKFYTYLDEKIQAHEPGFVITAMTQQNEELYLGANDGKIYSYKSDKIDTLTTATSNQSAIIELSSFNGKILAGTRRNGLFVYENNSLKSLGNAALTQFLETNELNKIQPVNDELLILGTVKGGIAYYNTRTGSLKNHYRQNGLQNNTVLSLHKAGSKIWIGLDNGIDLVLPDTAVQYFLDNSGELGAVYDLAFFNGATYAGTNTGVHKITDDSISFIPGSQGQVWSFTTIDDRLFINHNLGLFELKNDKLELITGSSGSYGLIQIPQTSQYLNYTYNGLRRFHFEQKQLEILPLNDPKPGPVERVLFENSTNFWAAHPYKGFYRAELDLARQKTTIAETYDNLGELSAYKTHIHQIKGQIAFYNAGDWYRYNSINDTLESFEELQSYNSYALISKQNNFYWFKNRKGNGLVYTNFKQDSLFMVEPLLESRIVKNYENIIQQNDSIFYVTLNEGYGRINLARLKADHNSGSVQPPLLTGLKTGGDIREVTSTTFDIPYKEAANLSVLVAAPALQDPSFYYELSNGMKGQFSKVLSFQNLTTGDYILSIWSYDKGARSDQPLTLNFTVQRPWYLANLMLVIYVILLLGVVVLIAYINRQKLNKHRRELELKLIKEQDRRNQIAERNKLLQEINAKRKELANTTYLAAKRNSSLIDIKNELEEVKEKGGNPKKVSNIQNKINHIIDAKDNWKVFETTFKEINDEFFQKLLEDHPALSSKDLKLCAYLKMNLATKEIAPLMAISVRGVEIHRYRLRKKLGLKSGKNLSKFLIKNY
ncbi:MULTISPECIES: hypothetical protein [unclassified Leeuwenhoekiella]|uniref:helix-turn-helix and ligand-binding sensor domain-containing protein n=1 Tax=unclassified Leeuwenhoekiella TaxID=2615029 RepID=UPI000C6A3263|nr:MULTISPECIES: hypothetical protein [unclassified Leeuwenhoekiella]MAW94232.1 hypothetical protein [Leeuwenhoekiella sp.]MAW96854.1 hypothetical protein [Leeuwenhoekiella sp.]MBA80352.1 hypothetical protein [Leeuwenhoekiella sp.]|tara:strand:+ start:26435 stop:29182 length:2748 start_codon:yes stop_codon:yes gene_type:complete